MIRAPVVIMAVDRGSKNKQTEAMTDKQYSSLIGWKLA